MYSRTTFVKVGRLSWLATTSKDASHGNAAELASGIDAGTVNVESRRVKNISRLRERHRLIAESRLPPVSYEWEKEKLGKCRRFGKYGLASGVSPAELWPTIEEIEEKEAFQLYKKFREVAAGVKAEEEAEKAAAVKRLKEVAENESKYKERLKAYEASLTVVAQAKTEAEEKLEQRILEIQEYFGYRIDPKDPRFEVMFAQKEAEELKAKKEAKRLEKLKKTVASVATDSD